MLTTFIQHIEKKKLFRKADRLLLGVSGGRDSMALAHLLMEAGHPFSVAHCNFGLRGAEADAEETFVKEYFGHRNIEVISTRFQTKEYAAANACSVQMAARELRYSWFAAIRKQHGFDFILTAHHANDTIETFFINLLRGTGLNGLKGIPQKAGHIVRPLLFATREQIDQYIHEHTIPYREDSSNTEEKYLRNKLRHQLIPMLQEINPSLEETMCREMEVLHQSHTLLSEVLEEKLRALVHSENGATIIELEQIRDLSYRQLLLHEALRQYGFNSTAVSQLNESIDAGQSGKQFFSSTHVALIDRDRIIVQTLRSTDKVQESGISEDMTELKAPVHITIRRQAGAIVLDNAHTACLDAAKITFPLQLTRWKEGDFFHPLGMKGSKKLSDFFVSQKMSLFEKQQQWILRAPTGIVWILGRRVDERYKVDEYTQQTLILEWRT